LGITRKLEIEMRSGQTNIELLKCIANSKTKDVLVVLPIPDVGFKLSMHSPRPPENPDFHVHWRSDQPYIHEDVDSSFFSTQYWINSITEFLNDSERCQPSSDEDIMVFHGILPSISIPASEKITVDIGQIVQTMNIGSVYQTKTKKLPSLVSKLQREYSASDLGRNFIMGFSEERILMPSSCGMIWFDNLTFMDKWTRVLRPFLDPVQKSLEVIQETYPNSIERWLPVNDIEKALNVQYFEPKIINF
jgi:hypothetical protein